LIPLKDNVPTARFAWVTVALIAVNVGFFVWQQSFSGSDAASPRLTNPKLTERDENSVQYGAIPYRVLNPGNDCAFDEAPGAEETGIVCQGTPEYRSADANGDLVPYDNPPWYLTILTSMFMHGGILHILFNMLFLWIFGNNIEDAMGPLRYLLFYLLAGLAAVYAQSALDPDGTLPMIGASGAVAGVLGAYALLLPRARVLTAVILIFFVTLIEIPAFVMLGIWFVLQFVPAIGQVAVPDVSGAGGVAYFAHVGGFLFGLALVKLFAHRRPDTPERIAASW
jgi:membrane associated rhomboid family serine protease